jgi:hypothetical protein
MANAITTADSAARPDPIPLLRRCPPKGGIAMTIVRERTA